ncbi:MAG: Hsp20/alpha crystallin family protein [Candidatus Methylomirabilis sp.]|nr:Hsp20/alpha crystallin family protein [Deltaproteobacteria bacterium]
MALKKKDPFKDLLFLQERMSRIFDETLLKYKTSGGNHWYPPVDIYETEDFLVLKAELPGVESESVSVEVSENTLSLKGERKFEKNLKEENYFRMERFYGSFQRAFSLPYAVDSKDIKANFQDGILKITVPKPKETGPGNIRIKVQ